MIVAIDGPAGTGKGTISKLVAARLNFMYVDTGAMYRAITLKMIRNNILLTEPEKIEETFPHHYKLQHQYYNYSDF